MAELQRTDKRTSRDSANAEISPGRTLPHSLEAEEYLLSCCLLDGSDTIARCMETKLTPAAFYAPANRIIYEKLCDLYQKSPPVELAVLAEELKTSRQLETVGGYPYLTRISSLIPTTAQAQYFIDRVRELHLLRELIKVATGAVESCFNYEGDLEQFIDKVEQDIFGVTQDRISDAAKQMKEPMHEAMNVITKMMMKKGELTGVTSGFKDLDQLTFGFQRQEMIVLAARPSMGKTSLALNFAEAASMPKRGEGAATLIFSLEMSAAQLALRMLCSRAKINMKLLREGLLSRNGDEQQRLLTAADEFSKSKIYIDDSSHLSIMELRAKARRVHARTKLGFIIVDYLQLLSPTDPKVPREQQVAEASRGLKSLAKELDVPVLVLSQLNRSSEKENRTPKLADLRESGSIEQDADVVLMLARPKDADEKFQVAADSAELIVAKQRNGPVGELKLTFLRDITRFENFTQ
ncbi:MAG: replicative DNA helicase [Opitutaceae bacterium]|nr:replicative DNA helicase [Opitutaceae bacterium]